MTERIYKNNFQCDTGVNKGTFHGHSGSLTKGSNLLAVKGTSNNQQFADFTPNTKIKLQVGGGVKKKINPINSNGNQISVSRNDNKPSLLGSDSYNQQVYQPQSINNHNNSSRTANGLIINNPNAVFVGVGCGTQKFHLNDTTIKNSSTVKKEKRINFSTESRAYNNTGQLNPQIYQQSSAISPNQRPIENNQDSIAQIYQFGPQIQQSQKDRKNSAYDILGLHHQSQSQRVASNHSNNSTQYNNSLFSQISLKDSSQTPSKKPGNNLSFNQTRNPSMMIYQNLPNSTQPIVVSDQKQYIRVNDKIMRRFVLNENPSQNQALQPLDSNSQAILNINTASDINIYNNSFIVNTKQKKQSQSYSSSRSNSQKRNQQQTPIINSKIKQQSSIQKINGQPNLTDRMNFSNIVNVQNEYSGKFIHNNTGSSSQGRVTHSSRQNSNPRNIQAQNQKFNQIAEAYSTQSFFNGTSLTQMPPSQNQLLGLLIGQRNFSSSQNSKKQASKSQKRSSQNYTQSFDLQPFKNMTDHDLSGSFTQSIGMRNKFKFSSSHNISQRQKQSIKHEEESKSKLESLNFSPLINQSNNNSQMKLMSQGLMSKGKAKMLEKDYQAAINIFAETVKIDSTNMDAKFYRALSQLDSGLYKEAINEFNEVLKTSPEHSQITHILLSIAHKRNNNIQEALSIVFKLFLIFFQLNQCIQQHPLYPDAYLARGQALLIQDKYEEALKDFQQYSKLMPNNGIGFVGQGDSYKSLMNWQESISCYTRSIALFSKQRQDDKQTQQHMLTTLLKRGLSFYHSKQSDKALSDLQQVISNDPTQYKAHFYIGKLLTRQYEDTPRITSRMKEAQKLQNEAILHFEQVVKHQLNEVYSGNALFEIAKLRLKDKDFYEAYFNLKRAIDSNFNSKRLQLYKDFTEGVLYLIKRKIKKGVQLLSDLLEVLVNTKDKKDQKQFDQLKHQAYMYRAYGYVAIEKYELALLDIKKAKKIGKLDLPSIYNKFLGKGILRMDHEDYLMATKYFNKASQKFPYNKDTYCLYIISIVRSYSYSMADLTVDNEDKREKVMSAKSYMDHAIKNCSKVKVPSLFFFRGLLYFQLHMFYEALQDFNVAIDEEEEPTASYFLARGRCYACLSILTEAMKDLSIALNLDDCLQEAYIYRGKCAYLLGDNNLAFLDFQRLILTDPKNPMVHVYAGNLLMTTGAYQDAIKAFSNADTVQQTAVAAFQRARCYCALTDLENAKMQFKSALDLNKNEALVKVDNQCVTALLKVIGIGNKGGEQRDKTINEALIIIDSLIEYFKSDQIHKLQKKDARLNIQIIPNVNRIKIEKAAVAKEIISQQNELKELSISIDMNQTVDLDQLSNSPLYSFYFENVFQLEDFYLFRGAFHFYKRDYLKALEDFNYCHTYQLNEKNINNTNAKKSTFSNNRDINPTHNQDHFEHLQMYSRSSTPASGNSTKTDLSDVGLCSLSQYEIDFNILLCYFMLGDFEKGLERLNEIISGAPKKYQRQFFLLRALVYEETGQKEKFQKDLTMLEKLEQKLYFQYFKENKEVTFEPFPIKNRLCSKFETIKLTISKKRPAILTKLSFSMPFIKPPNMIPNIDEEALQSEFTLKQIDAPMPEAPWIRRCEYGIKFTDDILQDDMDVDEQEVDFGQSLEQVRKDPLKQGGKVENAPLKGNTKAKEAMDESPYIQSMEAPQSKPLNGTHKGISERILQNATVYLVDNEEDEQFSDKHKVSLFDDSKYEDLTVEYQNQSIGKLAVKNQNIIGGSSSIDKCDDLIQQHLLIMSKTSDDEYDDDSSSEDENIQKNDIIENEAAIFDRESMVLMGDSVLKGIKKKKTH